MSFEQDKYIVVRNVISKELADFVCEYFINKRKVAKTLFDTQYLSPNINYFGT